MIKYGRWWAFQLAAAYVFQLGFHLEVRSRITSSGIKYGPYLDLHLPYTIVSIGRNPIYAGDMDIIASYSRGGINGNRN